MGTSAFLRRADRQGRRKETVMEGQPEDALPAAVHRALERLFADLAARTEPITETTPDASAP
jgi:hypothetical protein